jgi:predicted RNase H-like HicB family nuclease
MATFYVGMVDKGGEGWGVTFPDLPGCTSGGETMGELFAMSIEAARLWAEDMSSDAMPRPRSMDELLKDPEVRATIEAIGPVSFIEVPLVRDSGRAVRTNVSFDSGLLDAIDTAAKRRGLTRSAFLATAARDKIAEGA